MQFLKPFLLVGLLAVLSACTPSKFKSYDGPEVTRVLVYKESRRLYLMHNDTPLAAHDVALGNAPQGHKQFEGDGKTPEGAYFIDKRNPNSTYHLSIGISYPNEADIAAAMELGKEPGGDIFIHGEQIKGRFSAKDWTAGCISVTNDEMEMIYAMVRDGTPIYIYP